MTINPLSSSIINLLSDEAITSKGQTSAGVSGANFSDILSNALNTASEMDTTDKTSAIELLTGQTDDMSGLLLDAQKAELSLNLALQIRNKVVDAYNEIMRMQV